MSKFREIKIRPSQTLPPLSTDIGEKPYSFLGFLREWVLGAKGLRRDEFLPHLFEWEDKLESFTNRMELKAGVEKPAVPEHIAPPETPAGIADEAVRTRFAAAVAEYRKSVEAQQKSYNEAQDAYQKAVAEAAVGECLYVTDDAFSAGKESCKQALDKASTPNEQGQVQLPRTYEPKVLRHYHSLTQAKAVEEKDIPGS